MTMGDLPTVYQFLREFGLPTLGLVFVVYAASRCVQWVGREVVTPLRDRHFRFLDEVEGLLKVLEQTQRNLVTSQNAILEQVAEATKSNPALKNPGPTGKQ
jgi:hypothetical protein